MSFAFTTRLPLSRHELDRDYLSRSRPQLFDELWADDRTRVIVLRNDRCLLNEESTLAVLTPREVPQTGLLLFLGRSVDGVSTPWVAVVLADTEPTDAPDARLGPDASWGNLRELGSSLNDLEAGLFTEALALANWHEANAFSPRSGHPTVPALGGWVRRVEGENHDLFPRTDAAIIVGVTDADDRLLLGSNAAWKANRWSLLAGFVEPGESLENAVIREVFEESGIRITDPEYLGSQPWPFPASLMLGFRAIVDERHVSELTPDGDEILDLRWFSREELAASLNILTGDGIALPGGSSIARAIIEDWFGGPLGDQREW